MKLILQRTLVGLVALPLGAAALYFFVGVPSAESSAPSGVPATIATSSLMSVGPSNAVTLQATSSCTARVITTYANPVMLTFSDYIGQSPTAVFGHLQAASTTVAYDSGLYGCGLVKAYGYTASTSITFTSVR
jgi:hypothetical protein